MCRENERFQVFTSNINAKPTVRQDTKT